MWKYKAAYIDCVGRHFELRENGIKGSLKDDIEHFGRRRSSLGLHVI